MMFVRGFMCGDMVTRKKRSKSKQAAKSCYCGSCNHPHAHVPGYVLASLGIVSLPFTMGLVPGFGWVAAGWPILLILFGIVLLVKAIICSSKK
jgi:hypothetical protein